MLGWLLRWGVWLESRGKEGRAASSLAYLRAACPMSPLDLWFPGDPLH